MLQVLRNKLPNWLPVWLFLFLAGVISVFAPWTLFIAAMLFTGLAAYRMIFVALYALVGFTRVRNWEHTNWRAEYTLRQTQESLPWDQVLHLVVFATYNETLEILRQTLDNLAVQGISHEQVAIVLAFEADEPTAKQKAAVLEDQYARYFRHFYATFHPRNIPGEGRVKAANVTWAVRQVLPMLQTTHALEHIVITTCDSDSLLHYRYLESLTCAFATSPDRYTCFWQAPMRYHTNIWQVPMSLDIIHAQATVWELAYLAAPWGDAMPISTYSLSARLVCDVGFWDTDIIPDESHMFLKCLFATEGKTELRPIYLPFSARVVTGENWRAAFRNRYKQTLRHAWGVTEIGHLVRRWRTSPKTPAFKPLRLLWRMVIDNYMAGVGSVVLLFGGFFIPLLHPKIRKAAQKQRWLRVPSTILAVVGFFVWLMDVFSRPKRHRPWTIGDLTQVLRGFLFLPVVTALVLTFPALEAHIRWLIGKRIDFKVTPKED